MTEFIAEMVRSFKYPTIPRFNVPTRSANIVPQVFKVSEAPEL